MKNPKIFIIAYNKSKKFNIFKNEKQKKKYKKIEIHTHLCLCKGYDILSINEGQYPSP